MLPTFFNRVINLDVLTVLAPIFPAFTADPPLAATVPTVFAAVAAFVAPAAAPAAFVAPAAAVAAFVAPATAPAAFAPPRSLAANAAIPPATIGAGMSVPL